MCARACVRHQRRRTTRNRLIPWIHLPRRGAHRAASRMDKSLSPSDNLEKVSADKSIEHIKATHKSIASHLCCCIGTEYAIDLPIQWTSGFLNLATDEYIASNNAISSARRDLCS